MTHPLPTRRSSDRDEAVLQARAGTRVADHRQVDQQAAHVAVVKCDRLAARFLDAALPLRGMRVPVVDAVDLLAQEQALADRALGERAGLSADFVEHGALLDVEPEDARWKEGGVGKACVSTCRYRW